MLYDHPKETGRKKLPSSVTLYIIYTEIVFSDDDVSKKRTRLHLLLLSVVDTYTQAAFSGSIHFSH